MRHIVLLVGLSICFTGMTFGQKFAHLNLGNLLAQMPEVAEAEQNMKDLQDSLTQVYQARIEKLQSEYGDFQKKVAEGAMAPVKQQQKAQEFQTKQQEIVQFEQQIPGVMEMRRQQKLAPILLRVDNAIKAVAESNGFTMVFDTSSGSMLYAVESEDIMNLVKAELGI